MNPPRVADFADVLPMRDGAATTGWFSDHGSWYSVTQGDGDTLSVLDPSGKEAACINPGPLQRCTVWADRIELVRAGDGTRIEVAFADHDCLVLFGDVKPPARCALPVRRLRGGVALGDGCERVIPDDLLTRNRARWDDWFARAHQPMTDAADHDRRLLLARAVTTLGWNWRAPRGDLQHGGVVPSPLAYPASWYWDACKHAHALARFAPARAFAQLAAHLGHQRHDGMVPDTACPSAADDNWRNGKPPLSAWALAEVAPALDGGDPSGPLHDGGLDALVERCGRGLRWWDAERRVPGEPLHRYGGVDHQTATWDSGWDLSARFDGLTFTERAGWQLFDLWPADLAAYQLVEARAMAALLAAPHGDPTPWVERASAIARACGALWDREIGAFGDRRPHGAGTGVLSAACWLPVWAGAADREQTARTAELMLDPRHFATPVPFPALARSQPRFDPDGYWNGGVWLDHAALALAVLGRRGAALRQRLLAAVLEAGALYECYSPLTGAPCDGERPAVPQFSWSAAAVLEMLWDGPHPAAPGECV